MSNNFIPYWNDEYKKVSEKFPLDNYNTIKSTKLSNNLSKNIFSQNNNLSFNDYFKKDKQLLIKESKEYIKSYKVRLKPNFEQIKILEEWFNVTRYLYNESLELINKGHKINFIELRDLLVTQETKKNKVEYKAQTLLIKNLMKNKGDPELIKKEKVNLRLLAKDLKSEVNNQCKEWTLNVPKEIRANSIRDLCKNYNSAFSNLKNKNIEFFEMKFRKKNCPRKCILLQKNLLKFNKQFNSIIIAPKTFGQHKEFRLSESLIKDLKKNNISNIDSDTRLVKQSGHYYLYLSIRYEIKVQKELKDLKTFIGIDLGLRSLATLYGSEVSEFKFNDTVIKKIDTTMNKLRSLRTCFGTKPKNKHKRIRKKFFYKRERLKSNIINELHWILIKEFLKYDIVFLGDIKSHDIVKDNNNTHVNTLMNQLKFFRLKQRLLYKAELNETKVFVVPEHYTTQTCTCCGTLNKIGASKVYECSKCESIFDRDIQSSKSIFMKGVILNDYKLL